MAIPSQLDQGFEGPEFWDAKTNGPFPSPWQRPSHALRSGNMCHYVDASGVHNVVQIGAINTDGGVTQISVRIGGTEYANVLYDATGATHYSFHLPADG